MPPDPLAQRAYFTTSSMLPARQPAAGSVSNSVEIQFHHKDTKTQSTQSTQRKWHISIEFLGALAFLGVFDGKVIISTEKDTFPRSGRAIASKYNNHREYRGSRRH